jgi:hypothetical protein
LTGEPRYIVHQEREKSRKKARDAVAGNWLKEKSNYIDSRRIDIENQR